MKPKKETPSAVQKLTKADLDYILKGACILGSGGGGPLSAGQDIIAKIGSRQVSLISPLEVLLTSWTAVSAFVGSPDAAASQKPDYGVAKLAFQFLQTQVNHLFNYVLPGEVGAGNTFIPMLVAVEMGIPVIDAAGANRAIPGFLECTYAVPREGLPDGIPATPLVLGDNKNGVTLKCDNSIADAATRALLSGGVFAQDAGIAFWSMTGASMRKAAIQNTTTAALNLGQALTIGFKQPVKAVRDALAQPNFLLCQGRIVDASEATSGGFDFGTVTLKDKTSGAIVTIYNQNENLIAFSDKTSKPLCMGPDLICYLTTTGQVFSNADINSTKITPPIREQEIAVIGVPNVQMRNPFIIDQFRKTLNGIGYAGEYVPVEQLMGVQKKKAA